MPARLVLSIAVKKASTRDEAASYRWCVLKDARVSLETCRRMLATSRSKICLECSQLDMFREETGRGGSRRKR